MIKFQVRRAIKATFLKEINEILKKKIKVGSKLKCSKKLALQEGGLEARKKILQKRKTAEEYYNKVKKYINDF